MGRVRFRPLRPGEVIRQTFEAYRRLFKELVPIPFALLVPVYILAVLAIAASLISVIHHMHRVVRNGVTTLVITGHVNLVWPIVLVALLAALWWVAQLVVYSGVVAVIGQGYSSRRPNWREATRLSFRRLGATAWASLLVLVPLAGVAVVTVVVTGALAALKIGGIAALPALAGGVAIVYFGISAVVVIPVVLYEGRRGLAAVRRSVELVRGRWWATLGVLVAVILVVYLVSAIVQSVTGSVASGSASVAVASVVAVAVSLLLSPLVPIGIALVYFDLCNRRGGVDLDALAEQVGSGPAGPGYAVPRSWSDGPAWGGGPWAPPASPWPGPPGPSSWNPPGAPGWSPPSAPGWSPPPSPSWGPSNDPPAPQGQAWPAPSPKPSPARPAGQTWPALSPKPPPPPRSSPPSTGGEEEDSEGDPPGLPSS